MFWHDRLRNRYHVRGLLVAQTGLHIGTGLESALTGSPFIRSSGEPFVPGSSLKGVLRSTVERLAPNLAPFWSCALVQDASPCIGSNDPLDRVFRELREHQTTKHTCDLCQNRPRPGDADPAEWLLVVHTCDTCKLFGSRAFAGKVAVLDAPIRHPWSGQTEIRDGVGIDRDTERPKARIKFDLEVLPAETAFDFELVAENLDAYDRTLLAIGLAELVRGIGVGGRTTRGLGRCRLEGGRVTGVDLASADGLLNYLSQPAGEAPTEPLPDFIQRCLTNRPTADRPLWEDA